VAKEDAEKRGQLHGKRPSAAKAEFDLIGFIGTTEVVPFQNGVPD
jgi:hypothetical protein